MTRRRFAFLSLLLAALIVLAGCGNSSGAAVGADANIIRIAALEGTVHVTDDSRAELEARERMNLFSGYGVGTDTRSYTWIDLDAEKMLEMDEESGIGIKQSIPAPVVPSCELGGNPPTPGRDTGATIAPV